MGLGDKGQKRESGRYVFCDRVKYCSALATPTGLGSLLPEHVEIFAERAEFCSVLCPAQRQTLTNWRVRERGTTAVSEWEVTRHACPVLVFRGLSV